MLILARRGTPSFTTPLSICDLNVKFFVTKCRTLKSSSVREQFSGLSKQRYFSLNLHLFISSLYFFSSKLSSSLESISFSAISLIFNSFSQLYAHRAMLKLGAKNLFVLSLLVKNISAVYSADRCNF